jgi:hypothetical protein
MKQILCAVIVFLFGSCKDEGTPPVRIPSIQLTVEDVSCTEAWLRVSLNDINEPRTVTVLQDGQRFAVFHLPSGDSLLVVEGLLPRQQHTFVAQRLRDSAVIDASTTVHATTMDTTSHAVTWQIDTLGDGGSLLFDVTIINDTLAYTVGEIYLRDSTGQLDPQAYNMAMWNGIEWRLFRIQFYTFCGQPTTGPYATRAIFAFGPQDVWIAMNGSQVVRWNGQSQGLPMCTPVSVSRLWGESPNSVYAVGNNGGIARYSNGMWQRIESGTPLDLKDIWGSPKVGQEEVLVLASTYTVQTQESRILRVVNNAVLPVSTIGLASDMAGIWFVPQKKYYAVGAGIHRKRMLSDSAWVLYPHGVVTSFGSGGVRGTDVNNVFVAGSFGEIVHFNGVSWHRYLGGTPLPGGAVGPLAVTDRLVMAVGHLNATRGIVMIGRR